MKQRKRISLDWLDRGRTALEPLLALAYPRHCPLCGTILEQSAWKAAVCRSCIPEAERLRHLPPRLPVTEHAFYAVNTCCRSNNLFCNCHSHFTSPPCSEMRSDHPDSKYSAYRNFLLVHHTLLHHSLQPSNMDTWIHDQIV